MNEILRNRTIRPSSRLETSKSYKINTEKVSRGDVLVVNIDHETKSFKKTYRFYGADVANKDSISFRVNDFGTSIDISWSGAQPIETLVNDSKMEFIKEIPKKVENTDNPINLKNSFESIWTNWTPMPSPNNCRDIKGPQNAGVYQIRNTLTKQLIQFGIGINCQERMKSLFPKPYGTGTRNNTSKRQYILDNWQELEYRTLSTNTREEAALIESQLKAAKNHLFNT